MKPIRSILLTAFLAIIVISSVVYISSCKKKDKCMGVVCLNLGNCDEGNCTCPVGYEGSRCELLSRDKIVATFNGHDLCDINDTNQFHQYQLRFLAVPTAPLQLTIKNFLNSPDDSALCTMRSTDSFFFSGQNNATTFDGVGTFRKDTLRLTFRVQVDTNQFTCNYIGGGLW
jgi:hypothetical protein